MKRNAYRYGLLLVASISVAGLGYALLLQGLEHAGQAAVQEYHAEWSDKNFMEGRDRKAGIRFHQSVPPTHADYVR